MDIESIHKTPAAYIAFAIEVACAATCFYSSWWAGLACIIAIITQAAWQFYMEANVEEEE